jgi:antitoxin CptB
VRSSGCWPSGSIEPPTTPAQIAWHCRRGVKELDLLLSGWLRSRFEHADPTEQRRFVHLLELPDPDLVRYLLGGEQAPTPELASAVQAVLQNALIMSRRP